MQTRLTAELDYFRVLKAISDHQDLDQRETDLLRNESIHFYVKRDGNLRWHVYNHPWITGMSSLLRYLRFQDLLNDIGEDI